MRRIGTGSILLLTLLCLPLAVSRAAEEEPGAAAKLLGSCTVEQLEEEPWSEWFRSGYDDYTPNPEILRELRVADVRGVKMELFFGTWCGDSRREVPRLLKLLDRIGFPREWIRLVGVDAGAGVHKQSPDGEERGLELYRVPTLIVRRKGGGEIARLVETPALSLERDLLAILTGAPYEPNYRSYPAVRRWLDEGLLADPNVSERGLAQQVASRVANQGELAAVVRVLLERGDVVEAVKLAGVNCALYRDSASCLALLAEAQLRAGDADAARATVRRALRLDADQDQVEELLELLERSEGAEG